MCCSPLALLVDTCVVSLPHPILSTPLLRRYAAPEVSMGLPYGGKADVYSWSLLAWSVVSAKQPFEDIGRSTFYERVVVSCLLYTSDAADD